MNPVRSMSLVSALAFSLLLSGCGGGGGGGGATTSGPTPATIGLSQVTLTGEVPISSSAPTVTVEGVTATVTGRTWTATVPYGSGTFTIDYTVSGTLVARESVALSRP